jgi:hypothetical protein
LLPVIGRLPVTWHTLDMAKSLEFGGRAFGGDKEAES